MTTEQMDWIDDQRNARERRRWWRRMLRWFRAKLSGGTP